ncbi:MAG: enoyl-CoA hydratase-related protein [Rhodospirillales bacterium]|nr:enoyl-CoA hydratase-related protein [Rhodospirillales bacterium]MDP6643371.1 enoyl-CoA hydratase-related protein [Rhodospirillales bacterium]MDP6840619.1 enoyl-CoA hydratase-related protein [Rhodospirillales bacterium]
MPDQAAAEWGKTMAYEHILYDVEDRLATITFNRPERRNAIHWKMSAEISKALKAAEVDTDVSVIILKGAGDCFSSGYDLSTSLGTPPRQTGEITADQEGHGEFVSVWDNRARVQGHIEYMMEIWNNWKPVIAQVHGVCLGGASALALASDLLIAADDARLGHPGLRAIAPGEETAIFAWHVGLKKAKEMLLTGDALTAEEMLRHGMANHVFPVDKLESETRTIARRIANIDTQLLSLSKKMVNRVYEQMGFQFSIQSSGEFVTLAGRLPSNQEFKRISKEQGMKAAIEWRDGPFGGALGRYPPINDNTDD